MNVSPSLNNDIEEVLLTEEAIQARVKELGAQITRDYEGKEIILVAVLRGGLAFLADLSRNIHLSTIVDFMVVTKIVKRDGAAEVKIIKDLDTLVTGQHVVIVEDIIDEGRTLTYLVEALRIREPASLRLVTIFDKPEGRQIPVHADYVGFTIPDRFVVGYGLDYRQRYRNLPYLGVLKREVYEHE